MKQKQVYSDITLPRPSLDQVPRQYRAQINDLFDTWYAVRERNRVLTAYYDMKNQLKDLGISIPENLLKVNCVVGWAKKAVGQLNRIGYVLFITRRVNQCLSMAFQRLQLCVG